MAAYNAEKYISEAIQSIQKQRYDNWELIIVDDGSVDQTLKIAKSYEKQDNRIKVIHQCRSGTAAEARNTALKYVEGDFCQIIDSDDTVSNDLLYSYEKN